MKECNTIRINKMMPIDERISKIKWYISEWQKSIRPPFDDNSDIFRLERFEKTPNDYIYHYTIYRGVKGIK